MDFSHLLEMQCMLMSLMIVGYIIDRIGMIDVNGRKMLTDIVVGVTASGKDHAGARWVSEKMREMLDHMENV